MTDTTPDPAIVAALCNLDPTGYVEAVKAGQRERWIAALRRIDGTPASPEEIEAFRNARKCDHRAALDMAKLAYEQSGWALERKERIAALLHKYARSDDSDDTKLGVIEQRMTLADWVKYRALWDELGNVLVLTRDDEADA
jgi:hypothetical protein